jgi:hypothetical protein
MLLDEAGHGAGLALAAKRAASDRRPPKVSLGCFKSDVDDRDDPVVAVDDDDLITNDEVHVPAPLGVDLDERRGNRHHPHAGWHCGAGAEGEVDVIDPRHIAPGQDRLSDLRALLRCQVHAAARLALLRLTLLSLPLLRSLAWLRLLPGLALLRRLTGLLLALRRLASGLIALLLSLATLLGLTLLALLPLALLALPLLRSLLLRLTLLALLALWTLLGLAGGLLALALALAALLGLTLLALLALALLRLTLLALVTALLRRASGLLASPRLTGLLRLTLLALVLRAALALTGATLVVARSCRAAFRLRAALGAAAGFAARHVLG